MATKSISQLDTAATLDNGDLFETAIPDVGSASGYASKKMTLAQLADYTANDVVYPDFKTSAQSITGAVNQTLANFADEYDDTATYDVGDVVVYAGNLFKCETAVETAETFDPTKWTQGTAADFFVGGGDGTTLQVIAVEHDDTGGTKASYTSGSFTLSAGDSLVVGIMHRSALVVPDGFTLVKTASYGGQSISIIYKTATAQETSTYTIRQASSGRMSSFWMQIKGATISDAGIDYSGAGSSSFTATTPLRPYLLFMGNVYYAAGAAWDISPSDDIIAHNPTGKWMSAIINFGTSYHTSYTLRPPASDYCTVGAFLTAE